jgi:predicted nucleotidyltransferase
MTGMDVQLLINEMVEKIKGVNGVSAIALGGSRARHTHTLKSDIDLCIYYHADETLDLTMLNEVATYFDDTHRSHLLTPLGGWGPWINGGGWLTVQSRPVDLLYRDLKRVATVIEDCRAGEIDIVYQAGHPHGFVSAIYMGEIALCQILWEAGGQVSTLKAQTMPYPARLKQAVITKFGWEIDFGLATARKSIERADVTYAAGSCFRSVVCMLQVLFALNEAYWLNEKGAVALAETFAVRPPDFKERVEKAFSLLAADMKALGTAIDILAGLAEDTYRLIGAPLRAAHPPRR